MALAIEGLALTLLCALGPLERNHPLVARGIEAYERGEYQAALDQFEEASRALGHPPAAEYNRGNALYKLGRYDEARRAWLNAAAADRSELRQKDFFNIGNALVALGLYREAVAAYRAALRIDPYDHEARHNLELLLQRLQKLIADAGIDDEPSDGGSDGGLLDAGTATDAGICDGGRLPDAGTDGGGGDGGIPGDGGTRGDGGMIPDGGGPGNPPPDRDGGPGRGPGDAGGDDWDGGADGGYDGGREPWVRADAGVHPPPWMTAEEAAQLLDAVKRGERPYEQRFKRKRKFPPGSPDW